MAVGDRLSMTSKNAHPYRADAATRGLWHLDVGRAGFTVPDAAFEADADTALLYHLEESGPPIMDSSDSHNDGTLSGDPGTLAEGRFDNGVEFDGIDDTVRAPDAASLEPGAEDFTVEAFVKLDAEAAFPATVVARWNEQLDMRAYRLFIDLDGHLAAEVSADGTAATVTGLVGTAAVTAAEWHHVVLQRKGDVLSLWLDGEKEAEAAFAASVFDGAEELIVGAIIDVNGNPADVFTGVIDEVRVSAVARCPDEETPDSSGNENHGGLWRGAAITAADEGRFDRALSLDGADHYVEVPDDATLELGASDFTLEAWVKPSDLTGVRVIVSKWADADFSYRLSLDAGIPKLDLSSDGTAVYTLSGTAAVPVDEWTHVAATRSGAVVNLIVNDAVVATGVFAEALHDGPAPVCLGACAIEGAEGFFAGLIDEVRVSDVTREGSLGTVEVNYTYNARNQLVTETCGTSVKTYSYDRNGNTVSIVETVNGVPVAAETMTYDKLNRMLGYTDPRGSESFTYRGAEWHRFSQTASGVGRSFLYDGDNVVLDVGGPGGSTLYVTPFLDQNLSMTRSGATHYYSQDGLGSVRTLTDLSGSAKNQYDYLPFGGAHQLGTSVTVSQRYTYTGRELNPTSALMYYRYRQYDPRVGRFGVRDRVLAQNRRHLYAYVAMMPTIVVDPLGLAGRKVCPGGVWSWTAINAGGAFVIGLTGSDMTWTCEERIHVGYNDWHLVCCGETPKASDVIGSSQVYWRAVATGGAYFGSIGPQAGASGTGSSGTTSGAPCSCDLAGWSFGYYAGVSAGLAGANVERGGGGAGFTPGVRAGASIGAIYSWVDNDYYTEEEDMLGPVAVKPPKGYCYVKKFRAVRSPICGGR